MVTLTLSPTPALLPPGDGIMLLGRKGIVRPEAGTIYQETITMVSAMPAPIPQVSLPTLLPPAESNWATIQIEVAGCTLSTNGMLPVPDIGIPVFPWPQPPPAPPIPITFLPWVPNAPVLITTPPGGRSVGLPLALTPPIIPVPVRVIDCFMMPGNLYSITVKVTPTPGVVGVFKYEIPIISDPIGVASNANTLGTIKIVAALLDPNIKEIQ